MCRPTDSLLFAEDLMVFIARKHGIAFRSKIKVWKFRHELQTTFSRFIGDAVLKIISETEHEESFLARTLAKNGISIGYYIRGITVNYEENFSALNFLVRCAWICGLSISLGADSFDVLEEGLFLIANDLHKIPDPAFVKNEIWIKVQRCAGELIIHDDAFFRLKISPESMKYLRFSARDVDRDAEDDLGV